MRLTIFTLDISSFLVVILAKQLSNEYEQYKKYISISTNLNETAYFEDIRNCERNWWDIRNCGASVVEKYKDSTKKLWEPKFNLTSAFEPVIAFFLKYSLFKNRKKNPFINLLYT